MYGSRGAAAASSGGGMKTPKGYDQFQQFTPEQMQLFKSMFGNVGPDSYLGKIAGGDDSVFDQIEAPAMKQFSGLQGNLASRFSGNGGGRGPLSSRRSSGFQNTMSQASSDFASQLQSQRHGLKRQAIMDLMGLSENLLGQQPFGMVKKQHQPNWLESLLGNISGGVGQGLGMLPGLLF